MKTQKTLRQLNGIFNIALLLLCFATSAHADVEDHIFEKTIDVDGKITIKTNGMEIPRLDFNGWVSSSKVKGAYTLKTRDQLFLKVDKRFNINTWQKPQVKHVVKVTVKAATTDIENNFLKDLEQSLSMNAENIIEISNMLGLKAIMMKNGWLRGIENTVTTANGNKYILDYLEISAEIFLPETSNVQISNAHFTDFFIGKLVGNLVVELEGGSVQGTYIENVVARLNSSEVRLSEVKYLDVSAHQSKIDIKKVDSCIIGKLAFKYQSINFSSLYHGVGSPQVLADVIGDNKEHNSSINKYRLDYVDNMNVVSSANDKIDIVQVNSVELLNTDFTDLTIANLSGLLSGTMSYGELNILALEPVANRIFDLESFNGTVRIFGNNLQNLEVAIITNKVEPELMVNSKSVKPKSDERLLSSVRETSVHVGTEYVLKETKSNNQSTQKAIYLKGNPVGQNDKIAIYCNSCELTLR